MMSYEVERKYRIADTADLIESVAGLGGGFGPAELQVDTYYAHPMRDFAQTDEALRIRRVGDDAFITYKGPKLDPASKTRREIELPLADGVDGAIEHAELLEALGFKAVANVSKHRRKATITWRDHTVEVSLDEVERLGTFVEIEIAADDAGLDDARQCLASLAETLGLAEGERRSYLELLLSANCLTPRDGGPNIQ